MRTPHFHSALIKDWADGWEIQHKGSSNNDWVDSDATRLMWEEKTQYRRKPVTLKATITDGVLTLDDHPAYRLDLGILQEELRDTAYRLSGAHLEILVRGQS